MPIVVSGHLPFRAIDEYRKLMGGGRVWSVTWRRKFIRRTWKHLGRRRENLRLPTELFSVARKSLRAAGQTAIPASDRKQRMTIAATLPRVFAVQRIGERWSVLACYPNLPYLAVR
jgi:hypothetical protein